MRGIRLSTLMLLIVIAALVAAMLIQHDRSRRRIAELEALVPRSTWQMLSEKRSSDIKIKRLAKRVSELESNLGKDH